MKRKILIIAFLTPWLLSIALAQNKGMPDLVDSTNKKVNSTLPGSWNYLLINFWENPALAGIDNRHNVVLDINTNRAQDNFSVGYDFLLPLKKSFAIGIGANFLRKDYRFNNNRKFTFGLTGSVQYNFHNQSFLSGGLSVSIVNFKNQQFSNTSFFTAHFGNNTYNPVLSAEWDSGYTFKTNVTRFGPINIGIWYKMKKYFVGISFNDINRYNESIYEGRHPGPVFFQFASGYHFNIKGKVTITPSLVYRTQQLVLHQFNPRLTIGFAKGRVIVGAYYQNKRIYMMAGVDIIKHLQLTFDYGSPLSEDDDPGAFFINATIRVHFMTRKNKIYPE